MDKTLNHIVDSYYQPDRTFKEYKPPQHPLGPRATTPYNKPPIENSVAKPTRSSSDGRSSEQIFDLSDDVVAVPPTRVDKGYNENNDDFEEELTDDTE